MPTKQEQLAALDAKLVPLREQYAELGLNPTPAQIMALNWPEVRGEAYKLVTRTMGRYSGLMHSGYFPDTNQIALKVSFDQNEPFESQLDVLKFVEFIKPLKNGKYVITVFEYSLSEDGVYTIESEDGKEWSVVFTRYYHPTTAFTGDLQTALKYVYDNHPYIQRA
jgi:hypothetical protein